MKTKVSIVALALAAATLATTAAFADDKHHRPAAGNLTTAPATPGAVSATLSEGEIRRIDREQGKVTLKHGEIRNLEMPPMTMVFRVKDPAMLERVKVGDKIRFVAEQVDGAFMLTRIEPPG